MSIISIIITIIIIISFITTAISMSIVALLDAMHIVEDPDSCREYPTVNFVH